MRRGSARETRGSSRSVKAERGENQDSNRAATPARACIAPDRASRRLQLVPLWPGLRRLLVPSKVGFVCEDRGPYVMDDFDPSAGSRRRVGVKNVTDDNVEGVEVFIDSFGRGRANAAAPSKSLR